MTDREIVIKGLEEISDYFFDIYRNEINGYSPAQEYCNTAEEAIALLKNQEEVEPKVIRMNGFGYPVHACGKCGLLITESMNYCSQCGKKVKWE